MALFLVLSSSPEHSLTSFFDSTQREQRSQFTAVVSRFHPQFNCVSLSRVWLRSNAVMLLDFLTLCFDFALFGFIVINLSKCYSAIHFVHFHFLSSLQIVIPCWIFNSHSIQWAFTSFFASRTSFVCALIVKFSFDFSSPVKREETTTRKIA